MFRRPLFTVWLVLGAIGTLGASTALAEAPAWATYTVTFDATWSAATHPQSFPSNPHFSGLIGGTHDASVSFWSEGGLASTGIKQMAEWGSSAALAAEVSAAISAGSAGVVVSGSGIPVSPGQVATTFDVSPAHPLLTLTTMIAPSPDWFVGVHGLSLLVGDQWIDELVVPVYPYDAGTDSGVSYASSDLPTSPPVAISAITAGPFTSGVPLGTFTLRLVAAAAAGPPLAAVALTAQPNPFNPLTELRLEVPLGARDVQLAVFDARGLLVRRLAVAAGGGVQAVRWDGRTDDGLGAAAGVYFARLAVDGQVRVQKLALVR